MTKMKNVLMILFLALLTIGIIVIPSVANSLSFEYSIGQKNFWKRNIQTNNQVTSRQLVELYTNSTEYQSFKVSNENETSKISNQVSELFNLIFCDNTETCSHMKDLILREKIVFSQNYRLTSIHNKPVVLNIVDVTCISKNEKIQLTYEERSQTLIHFLYEVQDDANKEVLKNLEQLLTNYYENTLQLNQEQYCFKTDDKNTISFILNK